jgi:hypothetical protein
MRSPPPASRRMLLTVKESAPMVALSTRALFWIVKINLALCPSQQDLAEALALADHERSGYPWWTASGARSYAYDGSASSHHARQRVITRKTYMQAGRAKDCDERHNGSTCAESEHLSRRRHPQ